MPKFGERSLPAVQQNTTAPPLPPLPPLPRPAMMSFSSIKSSDEESKKAAVAAIAAKLAASTSSAQMLSSVLSSLVAEEAAASMNSGLKLSEFTAGLPIFPPEKKPKLEKPMSVAEVSTYSDMSSAMYFTPQSMNNIPLPTPMTVQPNHPQSPFASPPPPPPLPAACTAPPSANLPKSQYVQSTGMMAMPYEYGSNSLPQPPPLLPQIGIPLTQPLLKQPQQPQPEQPQQQAGSGGFYRPPGVGLFGLSHQSTSPLLRQ